jgi:putative cardiolipin synthase
MTMDGTGRIPDLPCLSVIRAIIKRGSVFRRAVQMSRKALVVILVGLLLSGCASTRVALPERPPAERALPPSAAGPLYEVESSIAAAHGTEVSGFHLLDRNEDGLRWRIMLIDSAAHSIDLQYYLWYGDAAGKILTKHLVDAANRGVRVRILVDDINTMFSDAATVMQRDSRAAILDAHPNIEIRLFNPWKNREISSRVGEMLMDLDRLNIRMHNKALVVDNRAAILGGRNIGDDYMGLHPEYNFHDLDVLGIGPVARQTSVVFDTFWNSTWVLPVAALEIETTRAEREALRTRIMAEIRETPSLERFPLEWQDPSPALNELSDLLSYGTSRVYTDMPTEAGLQHEMLEMFYSLVSTAKHELLITNAYIIPGERGIQKMAELSERGVGIRVLTNSLASHDVPAVNSHYKQWREPLLESGVQLYEIRPDAAIKPEVSDTPPTKAKFMGLHVKALVVDRVRAYIGSMNLDPRSSRINSEMGVVIESPALAEQLARQMERDMQPENSWNVQFDKGGNLRWISGDEVLTRQPARSEWQRIQDVFFMLFPSDQY